MARSKEAPKARMPFFHVKLFAESVLVHIVVLPEQAVNCRAFTLNSAAIDGPNRAPEIVDAGSV